MKKKTALAEINYCYVCLPNPFNLCYNVVMAAPTPLILVVQGESGVGKSRFAARIINEYTNRGYAARVLITEQYRLVSAEYYSHPEKVMIIKGVQDGVQEVVRAEMTKMYRENKTAKGFFVVIDSIASVTSASNKMIGARWNAQKSIIETILAVSHEESRYSVPTIAILLDQYRQGPPVPGTMISSSRGTLPRSLNHCVTAMFRLRGVHGQDSVVELSPQHYVMSPVELIDDTLVPSEKFTIIRPQPARLDFSDNDWAITEITTFYRPYHVIDTGGLGV